MRDIQTVGRMATEAKDRIVSRGDVMEKTAKEQGICGECGDPIASCHGEWSHISMHDNRYDHAAYPKSAALHESVARELSLDLRLPITAKDCYLLDSTGGVIGKMETAVMAEAIAKVYSAPSPLPVREQTKQIELRVLDELRMYMAVSTPKNPLLMIDEFIQVYEKHRAGYEGEVKAAIAGGGEKEE